jgi:hypothetical protein
MTVHGAKTQSALKRTQKSIVRGEPKISEGKQPTPWLLEPSVMAVYFDYPASDAEKKNQSLITRITTSLSKLCGSASLATSNGIKN